MCCTFSCAAQKHDTLGVVRVLSVKDADYAAMPIPVQSLNKQMLSRINSISVADAVKYFAGVNVKDYGGIGGLKTVSVRSLGANHTGVMYDGFLLGDAQGGQVDLGKFSLDNVKEIRLYIGGMSEILSPARAFATASLLSIKTSSGFADGDNNKPCTLGIRTGSFNYISPSVTLNAAYGKKIQMNLNGFYEFAKGDYSFISYEDNVSKEKRNNADISAYRAEYNLKYKTGDSSLLSLKAYCYSSDRGLPGAVILYNEIATQRLKDRNFFTQLGWQGSMSRRSRLLLGAEFSQDENYYRDPSYLNSVGKLINDFHRQEIYFSAAYKYDISQTLSAAFSSDFFNSRLKRTDMFAAGFARPNRNSFLNNIALQYKTKYFEATGNILYTLIREKVSAGNAGRDLHQPAESVSASIQPFKNVPVRIRSFYQHIFRAPTFNDLYYTNVGNTNLRPERADQYDLGITLSSGAFSFIRTLVITADAYLDHVKDKILAVPRQNLFQWSEQNIGIARIKGTDAAVHIRLKKMRAFQVSSDISYSFQQARDLSFPQSVLYKTQLPYTPEHSGSVSFSVDFKNTVFSWNIISSSYRYRAGEPIHENLVQGWSTDDVSISRSFTGKKTNDYRVTFEAGNIFNTQYEIIKYYPMPRFSYRFGILASFKKHKQP